jgi:hypothetical protein
MNMDVPEIDLPSVAENEVVVPHAMNISVKTCTLLGCFMYCASMFRMLVALHLLRLFVFCFVQVQRAPSQYNDRLRGSTTGVLFRRRAVFLFPLERVPVHSPSIPHTVKDWLVRITHSCFFSSESLGSLTLSIVQNSSFRPHMRGGE